MGSYLLKRSRRIFPGFWVCLVITAFVFAPAISLLTGQALGDFPWVGPSGAWDYVTGNFFLQIRQHSVGTVLSESAWPGSINGSLWSLFPEFACYIAVAALGLGGAFTGSRWLLVGAAVVAFLYHASTCVDGRDAFPHVPTFYAFTTYAPYLTAFAVGACASVWRDQIKFTWVTVAVLAISAVVLLRFGGFDIAAPILVTALVLSAAVALQCACTQISATVSTFTRFRVSNCFMPRAWPLPACRYISLRAYWPAPVVRGSVGPSSRSRRSITGEGRGRRGKC